MTQNSDTGPRRHRISELIGLPVEFADGRPAGFVDDVRLKSRDRLVTDGLVVGVRQHGSLLGYERRRRQGPAMVRALVRARNRNTGYVAWTSVAEIDTEQGVVRLRTGELDVIGDD